MAAHVAGLGESTTSEITPAQLEQFTGEGYVVIDNVLDNAALGILRASLDELEARDNDDESIVRGGGHIVTMHGLPLQTGPIAQVLQYRPVVKVLEQLADAPIQITGGVLLDKHPEHNWDIGWHPDNGIYVHAIPEGAPEDIRGGIPVYSTLEMELARNVSCRLALDPAGLDSGGLWVLPGSHLQNYHADAKQRFADETGVLAAQAPGSALCFRPLLLHRTEKTTTTARRRIMHLQYGPNDLILPGTEVYHWPQPRPLSPIDELL